MEFTKMHGLGNDFILINGFTQTIPADYSALSVELCQQHFGVGADGLILTLPSQGEEDFIMRIFNNDGSEAEMCGNGIRCVAMFAWEEGFCRKEEMKVKTGAGMICPHVFFDGMGHPAKVRVDMGKPRLRPSEIPVLLAGEKILRHPLILEDWQIEITCVSMGNPHCIIFVDDVENYPVETLGPIIETHPLFPAKTNVEFVEVLSANKIRMRVWERGCGITLACGTGACASAVASHLCGFTGEETEVALPGGLLHIAYKPGEHVFMTGPAQKVFKGVL